jgi:DNA adenine methylase
MLAPEEHERLAEALRRTPATVILSGYSSPLYDQLYADWHRIERVVVCGSSHAERNTSRRTRTEVLWSNRPLERGLPFGAPAGAEVAP